MNVEDSSAWLAYFADEPTAIFFAQAIEDEAFIAVAAMQRGKVVDMDADLAMEAAANGLEGLEESLALADSTIYTIAQKHSASLWTEAAHYSQKVGVQYVAKPKA